MQRVKAESRSSRLDHKLCLSPRTTTVSTIRMTRELNGLRRRKLQYILELLADALENLLSLIRAATLTTSDVSISALRNGFSDCASPDSDTVESLTDIDDNSHDFSVAFFFEGLADGREHDVAPEVIDCYGALLAELVGPFAAVLVLLVFPFWTNILLEEMVVGFEGQLGDGSNVVLQRLFVSFAH